MLLFRETALSEYKSFRGSSMLVVTRWYNRVWGSSVISLCSSALFVRDAAGGETYTDYCSKFPATLSEGANYCCSSGRSLPTILDEHR